MARSTHLREKKGSRSRFRPFEFARFRPFENARFRGRGRALFEGLDEGGPGPRRGEGGHEHVVEIVDGVQGVRAGDRAPAERVGRAAAERRGHGRADRGARVLGEARREAALGRVADAARGRLVPGVRAGGAEDGVGGKRLGRERLARDVEGRGRGVGRAKGPDARGPGRVQGGGGVEVGHACVRCRWAAYESLWFEAASTVGGARTSR